MKKLIELVALLVTAALASGCATPYMVDRGRDAADIFTLGVGFGVGAKARVGPMQTGLLFDVSGCVSPLRGGQSCLVPPSQYELAKSATSTWDTAALDMQWVFGGDEFFAPLDDRRHKGFEAVSDLQRIKLYKAQTFPLIVPPFLHDAGYACPSYYTQIEVVAALGPSIRLGFNPGELLDFILGWATVDIFSDDIECKKRKSNKAPGTR